MEKPTAPEEEIFSDRRSRARIIGPNRNPCRRVNGFGKSEAMPWWLKVNYVSQHLRSIEPAATQER